MTILNDIAIGLDNYLTDEVLVSIVDIALVTGTPSVINTDEIWRFRVKVENTGHINMTDVSLHVLGVNDTVVNFFSSGVFAPSITTSANLTVNGGSSATSSYLYFKAPSSAKPAGTKLLEAHVAEYAATGTTCSPTIPRAATRGLRAAIRLRFIRETTQPVAVIVPNEPSTGPCPDPSNANPCRALTRPGCARNASGVQ